jgi:hypothetical protein
MSNSDLGGGFFPPFFWVGGWGGGGVVDWLGRLVDTDFKCAGSVVLVVL